MNTVLARVVHIALFTTVTGAALLNLSACTDPSPSPDQQQLISNLTEQQRQLFEQGQLKAYSCTSCHGRNGISSHPNYPSLAGNSDSELASALRAYRSGERKHALMTPQARGLSDADISALAFYYSLQTAPAAAN